MEKATDYHFSLFEEIEKYRPKRNNLGDIDKCIAVCEKGMNNLPNFIKEWKRSYLSEGPLPSIPCSDVLIRCYLMLSEFEKAKRVVTQIEESQAWGAEEAEKELEFIIQVEEIHKLVQKRIEEYPGSLQRDMYKIYPDTDKDAMRWYFANSRSIKKQKRSNTYALWLLNQEMTNEIETVDKKTISDSRGLEVAKQEVDLSKFPNWHVSISFGRSTSKNYTKAVAFAKSAPQYLELFDQEGNIIHQAVYSDESKEYLAFITLYELIGTWKSCFVILNGELVDRKIIGGLNYCYGDKIRSGNPEFCFGASQFTTNPFGCHRLQISSYNNPWWSFGEYDNRGIWHVDKEAILIRINNSSVPYLLCPAFSMDNILRELDNLPQTINPKRDPNWIADKNGVTPKSMHEEMTYTIKIELEDTQGSRNNSAAKNSGCLSSVIGIISFVVIVMVII